MTYADRKANNELHRSIAIRLFERTGYLYEYKTGLFELAERDRRIDAATIIERNLFHRLLYISQKKYAIAVQSKLMQKGRGITGDIPLDSELDQIPTLLDVYRELLPLYPRTPQQLDVIREVVVAKGILLAASSSAMEVTAAEVAQISRKKWPEFLAFGNYLKLHPAPTDADERTILRRLSKRKMNNIEKSQWVQSGGFDADVLAFGFILLEHIEIMRGLEKETTPPPPAPASP